MKTAVHGGLILALALGLTSFALAQAVPWKTDDPDKTDALAVPGADAATGAAGAAPAAGADSKMEKAAAPVKKVLAQADAFQKQIETELAMPDDKKNPAKIRTAKESIVRLYMSAALTAKAQSSSLKGDEKQAFMDQYEKPNRDKAIDLMLELATDSLNKQDYRSAESITKQVLGIDPRSGQAEALLKRITDEKKAAAKAGSAGSGNTLKDKNTNTNITDFGRTGGQNPDSGKTGKTW
jgi:hypothetical protein